MGRSVGLTLWSADLARAPPALPFGEQLLGGFLKAVQGATYAEVSQNAGESPLQI